MYNYRYNELGNIVEETRDGSRFKSLEYDRHNRLAETTVHTSDETLVYTPIYETRDSDNAIYADNAIKGMTLNGIFSQSVDKDKYGRPVKASLKVGNSDCELLGTEYSYLKSKNRLTGIVDTVTHKVHGYDSGKYKYTYDVNGNITVISKVCGCDTFETVAEYEYDGLNRLVRENNYILGETYTYKYDAAGNILSKSTYDVTSGAVVTPKDVKLYRYATTGWKDKLIVYDGQVVAYDTMGNPWSYCGHTLEWSRIRLLTKWDDIDIEYNASGIRTRKGNTYYEIDGSTIISETTYGSTIRYYYGNGGIVGFRYNGNRYYYEKNLMGDIIGIYDESGSKVAGYIYDAWGNCTVQTYGNDARIAEVNPFRYRGYYFDSDIGLYYLKSRYYDAKVGRFINADGIEYLGANGSLFSHNLYAYCDNRPVFFTDSNGNAVETIFDIISLGASIIEVAVNPTDVWAWAGVVGDAIDLIPFVTGIGEATRGIKIAVRVTEQADDVIDAAKTVKRSSNAASGSYEILYESGKNYVGKGSFDRAITSAAEHAKPNKLNDNLGDTVTSIRWRAAPDTKTAFVEEYALMTQKGVNNADTYNKIWSPGKKIYHNGGGK